ncbi:hypothetical protein [Kineococcus sp. NUM-3379]
MGEQDPVLLADRTPPGSHEVEVAHTGCTTPSGDRPTGTNAPRPR